MDRDWEWSEVQSPYDGTLIGRVPAGDAGLVEKAVDAAVDAFEAGTPSMNGQPSSTGPPTSSPSARTT